MSPADRPWWATDEDAPADDVDPLDAHRAARRGPRSDADEPTSAADEADPPSSAGTEDPPASGRAPVDDGSWWVPATEAVTRLARDLTASAVASPPRGLIDDEQVGDDPGERSRPEGPADARTGGGGDGGGGHRIDACGVCPICVGLRALGDARPDLVGHLAEAARQLALAVRTVVDAAAPADQPADPPAAGPRRDTRRGQDLHRIDLDD